MKELTLVRHAKSSWELDLPDNQRPLNPRGIRDANKVSNILKKAGFKPDLVLSSNAVRAKTTAETFIKNLNISSNICHFNHELYDFSGEYLTFHIKNCSNNVNHVMVFGHNDAITNFVNTYGNKFIDNVPTCGVVTIKFDTDRWNQIKHGETIQTIFPKQV